MRRALILAAALATGCIAQKREVDGVSARVAEDRKVIDAQARQIAKLEQDVIATQNRLDNALRASADTGSDLVSEKRRINEIAGRLDELDHGLGEVKRDVGTSRTEVGARLDELKRAIDAQATKPAPVVIPEDKSELFTAIEAARAAKDGTLLRTLGREYTGRYPFDEKADDVLYYLGWAELADGHPSAALGDFNRLLKSHPKSNVMAQALFGMGEAYSLLRDCDSAKLAFSACQSRFAKEKIGQEAQAKLAALAKPAAGVCAPQGP